MGEAANEVRTDEVHTKICPICRRIVEDRQQFCPQCGNDWTDETPIPQRVAEHQARTLLATVSPIMFKLIAYVLAAIIALLSIVAVKEWFAGT